MEFVLTKGLVYNNTALSDILNLNEGMPSAKSARVEQAAAECKGTSSGAAKQEPVAALENTPPMTGQSIQFHGCHYQLLHEVAT